MLVRAVDDAGIPVAHRAAGAWNLLSGAVQALVVRDMLGTDVVERLIGPFLAALGPTTQPSAPEPRPTVGPV
jgi:hypothetical protein